MKTVVLLTLTFKEAFVGEVKKIEVHKNMNSVNTRVSQLQAKKDLYSQLIEYSYNEKEVLNSIVKTPMKRKRQ